MFYYKVYYGSILLRDSSDLDNYYETEEEAYEEAENEWDSVELFDIVIEEK